MVLDETMYLQVYILVEPAVLKKLEVLTSLVPSILSLYMKASEEAGEYFHLKVVVAVEEEVVVEE